MTLYSVVLLLKDMQFTLLFSCKNIIFIIVHIQTHTYTFLFLFVSIFILNVCIFICVCKKETDSIHTDGTEDGIQGSLGGGLRILNLC